MTLQNRVYPDGSLHAVPQRGSFMGNRGCIHNKDTKKLLSRRWTSKAWLICQLSFKNRPKREIMGHSYTELFFLDEVTALSSGHRPCYECRRKAFKTYQTCWQTAFALKILPKAAEMDAFLHSERLIGPEKRFHYINKTDLIDGSIITFENEFYALKESKLLLWHFSGYQPAPICLNALPNTLACLTPPSHIALLKAGYQPRWHDSAL